MDGKNVTGMEEFAKLNVLSKTFLNNSEAGAMCGASTCAKQNCFFKSIIYNLKSAESHRLSLHCAV